MNIFSGSFNKNAICFDSDDITYVLEICDEKLRKILLGMPNDLKADKKSLNYAEDSAGRIMQILLCFGPLNWTIGQVLIT